MPKINGGYYIKARCIKNSAVYKAPPYVREIWDYLLREANHADKKYNGYIITRGQLFRSYKEIRNDLSWKVGYRTERYNENQMKMGMRYLMKQLMITLTKQPRGNIITICNYDLFQNPKNYEATSEATNEATNGQPMGNQGVPSINKNEKKKEVKNKKEKYLEFVFLTKSEHEKLLNNFGNDELQDFIKRLNNYIGSSGKKYKSHYYTILAWDRTDKKKQGDRLNEIKSGKTDYSGLRGRNG